MFTLDQLRCFVAVAKHLHFGRAAAELNMTQPPLSRQIQKLERLVGAELLDRDNRHVRLTPAGELFLAETRKLLGMAERAPEGARRVAAGSHGLVRIGFTAASGFGLLGNLLTVVNETEPGIDVDLVEMVTADQLTALDEGRIDLALGRVHAHSGELHSQLLLAEKLILAVPEDSPLAHLGRNLTRADVVGHPIIMHSAVHAKYFYDIIVGNFEIDPAHVRYSLSQIMTMVNLVGHGHGIAFVPESARYTRTPGVTFLSFADFRDDVVRLHALWRPETTNPALQRVLAAIGD